MTRSRAWLVGLAVFSMSCADDSDAPDPVEPHVGVEGLGVLADFGVQVQSDPLSVITKAVDAVILPHAVVVLDMSPPWLRVFDREGSFQRYMVLEGDGPGEARDPTAIARTASGDLVVSHARGLLRIALDGTVLSTLQGTGRFSSAIDACGGLVLQEQPLRVPNEPRAITYLPSGTTGYETGADTLVELGPQRLNSRSHHTWFAQGTDAGIVFYTEEVDRPRLLRANCEGGQLGAFHEVVVDSLGLPERHEIRDGGNRLFLYPPEPPFPAGVVQLADDILWATQTLTAPPESDSTTVISVLRANGARRQLTLHGWFQILAGDEQGVLLGNSWGYGTDRTWGAFPSVRLVSTDSIFARAEPAH